MSKFILEREKVGGEKGGEWRLWECGKPVRVFHHFHGRNEGEKGGGDFLFKADQREAALWLPLFPLPAAAIFLFASFSFGGGFA